MREASPAQMKPLLRGWSHLVAAVIAIVSGAVLVARAPADVQVKTAIYVVTLCALFMISAAYHRPNWEPQARAMMRRLDHSAIFLLIAGTFTPYSIVLDRSDARMLLILGWGGAVLGILRSVFWVTAPKPLIAISYLLVGWAPISIGPSLFRHMGPENVAFLVAGGLMYSLGAVAYALKRPNPWPRVFGYHEIFHLLVVFAAACHFVSVARIVMGLHA